MEEGEIERRKRKEKKKKGRGKRDGRRRENGGRKMDEEVIWKIERIDKDEGCNGGKCISKLN